MHTEELTYTREKVLFKEGDTICKEDGEDCNEMYVIASGRVSIVKKVGDTDIVLTTLDEGDFFGEMALITGSKRSASAIAHTKCKINTMDKDAFEFNLTHNINFTRQMLETLASRLEATDTNLKRHIQRSSRLSNLI